MINKLLSNGIASEILDHLHDIIKIANQRLKFSISTSLDEYCCHVAFTNNKIMKCIIDPTHIQSIQEIYSRYRETC